jgi:hypothetical protein
LDNAVEPYVKKDKFLLIINSWGRQTNPALHDKKFLENDELTCSLKIKLPKCTLCATKIKRLKFSKSQTGSDVRIQLAM